MDDQKTADSIGRADLSAALAVAEHSSRKHADDDTAGDDDAPMHGPRERNRELEDAEARSLAEEEREREEIEAFLTSLLGCNEVNRDFLDHGEDELAEPRRTYFADDLER